MTSTPPSTSSTEEWRLTRYLSVEEEAALAERDGIPRWMFYHEMAIHEREAAVQAFLKAIPDMLFLLDREGTFLNFKKSKDLEWLAPGSRFLRKTLREVLPPAVAQQFMDHVEQVFLTGQLRVFEYQLTLNGQRRDFEVRLMRATPYEVLAITRDMTEHKRLLHQLQALSRRLLDAQEAERRNLARELHDEVGQNLTGVALLLEQLAPQLPATAQPKLDQASQLIQGLIDQVRNLGRGLRPAVLDDLGLAAAVRSLVKRYQTQTRIQIDLSVQGGLGRFAPIIETAAYRIVQEALTNIARYAQVEQARVVLLIKAQVLSVEIQDWGRGFDLALVSQAGLTYGLDEMQERARLLGGQLTITTAPGQGTHLIAELPIVDLEGVNDNDHHPAGR